MAADDLDTELVWYFAYGSNLQAATLAGRRGIRWRRALPARVAGWELVIDKPSLLGMPEAFANLVPRPGAVAYGVVYELAAADHAHVELTEGVKIGNYARVTVRAELLRGDGAVDALSLSSELRRPDLRPSTRYMGLLLEGARAHGLPAEWIEHLGAVPTCVEDEASRALRAQLDGMLRGMRRPPSGGDGGRGDGDPAEG